ncbi:BspA family leucine-rich repeat surface protein [Chryseobacterium tongliaoense]|uniref:BspA family leucine-rich repeat surface protein n=1 Tax=Chryseobacterium tongliaoense TaxID=3240933 RepID=UPI003518CDC6
MYKKLIVLFFFIISVQFIKAQNEFITIWKPGNIQPPGSGVPYNSSATQAWLPLRGNDYTISWEEVGYPSHQATLTNVTTAYQILLDFGTPLNPDPQNATYRVKVSNGAGNFYAIRFKDQTVVLSSYPIGDTQKLMSVEQWGTIAWTSMREAFSGCSLMNVTATDLPNLSNVHDMYNMFFFCSQLIGNPTINNWNISAVTNLDGTFMGCSLFNQPVGNWDTSNVETMAYLFFGASVFNQPLANWNTSNVNLMIAMFHSAEEFNQPIGNWDLSENSNSEFMFANALKFNQPIGNWNISNLIETDHMFYNAAVFNQDIGSWDTSNITNMNGMFSDATAFNQNIRNWNVGNVINMSQMFQNAKSFNQDIGIWDTGNVYGFVDMFNGASHFNQNLGQWNLGSLLYAQNMFLNSGLSCQNYNDTLHGWNLNPATPNNINLSSVSPLIYSSAQAVAARNNLINNKGWTITGDTYNAECAMLSTSDTAATHPVEIYPNPATDFIYIKNMKSTGGYKILDASGRIVVQDALKDEKINISHLMGGNYILQIITKDMTKAFKFIKK